MSDQSVEQRLEELRSWYEASGPDHPGSDLEIFFTRIDASQERERVLVKALNNIRDCWNGLPNERAMHDACQQSIEIAEDALREVGALEEEHEPTD